MKERLKVGRNTLLMIAGIVWGIAGFNILRIGIMAYRDCLAWWRVLISIAVYAVFQWFVFGKMVRKHTKRILGYKEARLYFIKFFDIKGFCVMAFMMTFGIGLRTSGICPDVWIAIFYSGLGASLLTAGLLFIVNFIRERGPRRTIQPERLD